MLGKRICLGVIVVCVSGVTALAAPLNLVRPNPAADITGTSVTQSYVAGTGVFHAEGTTASFDLNGVLPYDYPSASIAAGGTPSKKVVIDLTVNQGTGALISGTVKVTGTIPSLLPSPANSGTLLSGTLSAFGFPTGGANPATFEFLFDNLSGDLAPYFANGKGGIVLTANNSSAGSIPFTGTFTSNFNTGTGFPIGVVDIFDVPEPSAIALTAVCGLLMRNRRRN